MYAKGLKRIFDFLMSLTAILVLSPVFLILTVAGAFGMKGNPFFTQRRPGKDEKIFLLLKFRTMTNERDEKGELLPDEMRMNTYGKFLRKTSLDELPQIVNILKGDMAIIGPRPLLVKYLPLYNERQQKRHEVRPGLTGYSQVYGRNDLPWEEKFEKDVFYVENLTFRMDVKIFFKTIAVVLKHEGVSSATSVTMEEFKGTPEKETTSVGESK